MDNIKTPDLKCSWKDSLIATMREIEARKAQASEDDRIVREGGDLPTAEDSQWHADMLAALGGAVDDCEPTVEEEAAMNCGVLDDL
tara:strand:- start:25663 stop:25920 length:258 start_codon:yes stop_codon:yes gene_type:complete